MSDCLSVAQDLANRLTDKVLLYNLQNLVIYLIMIRKKNHKYRINKKNAPLFYFKRVRLTDSFYIKCSIASKNCKIHILAFTLSNLILFFARFFYIILPLNFISYFNIFCLFSNSLRLYYNFSSKLSIFLFIFFIFIINQRLRPLEASRGT